MFWGNYHVPKHSPGTGDASVDVRDHVPGLLILWGNRGEISKQTDMRISVGIKDYEKIALVMQCLGASKGGLHDVI